MTTIQKFTFSEYLAYDDGTDKQYEFVEGKLVEMPPESPLNSRISFFLALQFAKFLPEERICHKDTEIVVSGTQIQTRLPDLMVISEELAAILEKTNRETITLEMPPPELIIEVASPGKKNRDRDYRFKRSEYAARGIPEYWIVDQEANKVTFYTLMAGFYEEQSYTGQILIKSRFEALNLTADQVFKRKK